MTDPSFDERVVGIPGASPGPERESEHAFIAAQNHSLRDGRPL